VIQRKALYVSSTLSTHECCPKCSRIGNLNFEIYIEGLYLGALPIYGKKKKTQLLCSYCKEKFRPRDIGESAVIMSNKLKSDATGPAWQDSGIYIAILLVAILTLVIVVRSGADPNEKRNLEVVEKAEPGTLFAVVEDNNSSKNDFTTNKIYFIKIVRRIDEDYLECKTSDVVITFGKKEEEKETVRDKLHALMKSGKLNIPYETKLHKNLLRSFVEHRAMYAVYTPTQADSLQRLD